MFTTETDETFLLALLNSTPVIDGVPQDDLADATAARTWLRAHDLRPSDVDVPALLSARTALQSVVRGRRSPTVLAPFLDGVSWRPSASKNGLTWALDVADAGTDATAARAVLAWDALRLSSPGRLRACANPECQLFLIDHSKPNSARWCSMAICGNRMKARRHYERNRQSAPDNG